jgi:zinc and cadmium transporter
MATYAHIIFYSLIGGVFSLIGGLILLSKREWAEKLAYYATPFSAGALLAAVFLDLLKEGLHESEAQTVLMAALIGILLFFFAERFLHWFHHHHAHTNKKLGDPSRSLIVVGDTLHNALDGVAIAAAFLVSVPTGIVTTMAVAAHEIPQEVGDFGLLLAKGMRRKDVLLVNIVSALATTLAAVITFALGSADRLPNGVLLGLSAGFLLYIALSDIIPSIHEKTPKKRPFDIQAVLVVVGVLIVGWTIQATHSYLETDLEKTCQEISEYREAHGGELPGDGGMTLDQALCLEQEHHE